MVKLMTPEKCLICEKFVKLKKFEELRTQFHNWCEKYERPVALCKCKGSKLALKYLNGNVNENGNEKEFSSINSDIAYNVLKINF
ncbi:MAG: hypothetical protein ACTSRP_02880 [Candidatus Helarchaeota archaeon]